MEGKNRGFTSKSLLNTRTAEILRPILTLLFWWSGSLYWVVLNSAVWSSRLSRWKSKVQRFMWCTLKFLFLFFSLYPQMLISPLYQLVKCYPLHLELNIKISLVNKCFKHFSNMYFSIKQNPIINFKYINFVIQMYLTCCCFLFCFVFLWSKLATKLKTTGKRKSLFSSLLNLVGVFVLNTKTDKKT